MKRKKTIIRNAPTVQKPLSKQAKPVKATTSGPNRNTGLIIVLLLTFLAYLPALKAGIVNWDDGDYVFFSSIRRHTRCSRDWSSDVCSSDLPNLIRKAIKHRAHVLHHIQRYSLVGIDDLTSRKEREGCAHDN